jgi:hypothetical protein
VRELWRVQRDYAGKRRLDLHTNAWRDALYGKWVDPIMSLIAAYELLRRGERGDLLREAIGNLRRWFADLPDVSVLAKLFDPSATPSAWPPASPPILRDGLDALDDDTVMWPFPPARLSYDGPWTAWRRAVAPPTEAPPPRRVKASTAPPAHRLSLGALQARAGAVCVLETGLCSMVLARIALRSPARPR